MPQFVKRLRAWLLVLVLLAGGLAALAPVGNGG